MRTLLPLALVALVIAGCDNGNPSDGDADSDADADTCVPDPPDTCCQDSDCSDGLFCNGIERCDLGSCLVGTGVNCDDGRACTLDQCDELANLCVHVPQHETCDDDDICNGSERCEPSHDEANEAGCIPGFPMVCDDGDDCTRDFCEDNTCQVDVRDADGDGYGDRNCQVCDDEGNCTRGDDCDDNDINVHLDAEEICDDGKDNNCDRVRDYAEPGCDVPNDTCGTALELHDREPIFSSTRGTSANIEEGCGPTSARDVAFYFVLSQRQDAMITIEARGGHDIYVAVTSDCGAGGATFRCEAGRTFDVSARDLAPGTYYVVTSAASETDFSVELRLSDVETGPDGDTCATAIELPEFEPEDPVLTESGTLVDAAFDYSLSCVGDPWPDVVLSFDVPDERGVQVDVARTSGEGQIAVAVFEQCGLASSEWACWLGDESAGGALLRLFPGAYYLVVAAENEVEFDVTVTSQPIGPDTYFVDDFSTGALGWTFAGGDFEHGFPGRGDPDPYSGACIGTVFGGNYTQGMTFSSDYAQSPAIDLSSAEAPVMRYFASLECSTYGDGAQLQVSTDGRTFSVLSDVTPGYNGTVGSGSAWLGTTWDDWTEFEADLADYAGQVVYVRFAFYSDWWEEHAGLYVDNIVVSEP